LLYKDVFTVSAIETFTPPCEFSRRRCRSTAVSRVSNNHVHTECSRRNNVSPQRELINTDIVDVRSRATKSHSFRSTDFRRISTTGYNVVCLQAARPVKEGTEDVYACHHQAGILQDVQGIKGRVTTSVYSP